MASGTIDKIQVGLGIDQSALKSELEQAKKTFDSALPSQRTIPIRVQPNWDAQKKAFDAAFPTQRTIHATVEVNKQALQALQAQLNAGSRRNDPSALRLLPRLQVDRRSLDEFRVGMQRGLRQAGAQNAIRVPVQFNGDTKAFVASVERSVASTPVKVNVVGHFTGWDAGGGPPSGGAGRGGGGGRGGGPTSSGPAGGGLRAAAGAPVPAEPVRSRPRTHTQRTTAAPVVGPSVTRAPGVRPGTEARTADVYQVQEEPATRATRTAASAPPRPTGPATPSAAGSRPPPAAGVRRGTEEPTPAQAARQTRRTQRARERTSRSGEGMGTRTVLGEQMPVPPARIDIGNVRTGAPVQELQGEERIAATSQLRARPTPGHLWATQPGEGPGALSPSRRESTQRLLESRAQEVRERQVQERAASPEDIAARGLIAGGLHGLNPDLAAMLGTIGDPEYRGSFEDLLRASGSGRRAYATAFHGQPPKNIRKQIKRIRNPLNRQGDLTDVDPTLLTYISALDAARRFQQVQVNPTEANLSSDVKRRGPGGKVGQRGGLAAGTLSSESVDPGLVDEIIERRIRYPGVRGHGWAAMEREGIPRTAINLAKRRLRERGTETIQAYKPGTGMPLTTGSLEAELEPGKAYGGFMGAATPVPGGQGMFRTEKELSPLEAAQEAANRTAALGMTGTGPRDESRYARPRRNLAQQEAVQAAWNARRTARASGQIFDRAAFEAEERLRGAAAFRNRRSIRGFAEGGESPFITGLLSQPRNMLPGNVGVPGTGIGIKRIKNLAQLKEYAAENPGLYSRWTPSMKKDMQPGATSAHLLNRRERLAGISATNFPEAPGMPWEKLVSSEYDLGPAHGDFDYRRNRLGREGYRRRNLWLMEGQAVGAGLEGEPLLDPTSIKPRAAVSRKAVDEYYKSRRAEGGLIKWLVEGGKRVWGEIPAGIKQLYGRTIGASFGAPEGHQNIARANTTEWKAQRRAQIKAQPWCSHCGISVNEARYVGELMTADKVQSQAQGGATTGENLQTLCRACNSRKSGSSLQPDEMWPHPRPIIARHPKYRDIPEGEFLPGGKFFGVRSMGEIRGRIKKKAEGGDVRFSGLFNRLASGGHAPNLTMVGERGPELMVSDPHTGETEVIPTHKVPGAMDRLKGRQDGGDLGYRTTGEGARQRFQSTREGERGRFISGEEAQRRRAGAEAMGGAVQRVEVVNWPAMLQSARAFAEAQGAAARSRPATGEARAGPDTGIPRAEGTGGPRPGPDAGSAGGPEVGGPRPRGPNPLFRAEARRGARTDVAALQEDIIGIRSDIQGALQEAPVRALSVSFGQIAQQIIGGRQGILQRAGVARAAVGEAQQETTELERNIQAQREARASLTDLERGITGDLTPQKAAARRQQLTEEVRIREEAIGVQRPIAEARVAEAKTAAGGILTRPQQIRAQAAGLGGIIAGTALFTAAMGAFQTAMQAASVVIDPFVQSMLGFPAAIERSTGAVRDAITQMKGDVEGGAAAALAPSGVSARFLERQGQAIIGTGQARAAQQAAEQMRDITRAAGGLGGVRGRYGGVGGFLGTSLGTELFGGQPGFMQTVTGTLAEAKRVTTPGPQIMNTSVAGVQTGTGLKGGPLDVITSFLGQIVGGGSEPAAAVVPTVSEQQREAKAARLFADTVDEYNENLSAAAEYQGDVANTIKLVAEDTLDNGKALGDAMEASAAAIGPDAAREAKRLRDLGLVAVGRGGQAPDFGRLTEQLERGQMIQDPRLLMQATQRQRESRAFMTMEQGRRQREEDIPARFALQEIANPPLPFGQTFRTEGLAGTREGQKTLDNIAKYTELAADASTANEQATTAGMAAMEKIVSRIDTGRLEGPVVTPRGLPGRRPSGAGIAQIPSATAGGPGPALTQFRGLVSDIGELGEQIAGITAGINMRQTNLQVKEYNNQIRIASRSLGDAQDLWAGIHGDVSGSLGGLQGQNMLLERQNQILGRRQQRLSFKSEDIGFKQSDLQMRAQQLQFEQAQRQINFQKAVAGFTAPGMTSEERAARINEAKIEANYAQEQLDIQIQIAAMARDQLAIAKEQAGITREMFGNQVQQQDNQWAMQLIEAQRAMTDISAQLALLQEGRAVVIDTAAAEEAIARLRKQQGRLMDQAESMIAQGQEARSQILQDIAMAHEQTGKGFNALVRDVSNAWSRAITSYYSNFLYPLINSLGAVGGAGVGGDTGSGRRASGPGRRAAAGTVQTVNSPTQFLAGEAGTEHVIVLRNAKQGMFLPGGGGGGSGSVVNVGGIVISLQGGAGSEEDAERLAAAVERRLGNKLALIGA